MYVPEAFASTLEFLAIDYHFSNIARGGSFDSRNIIYFGSLLGIFAVSRHGLTRTPEVVTAP